MRATEPSARATRRTSAHSSPGGGAGRPAGTVAASTPARSSRRIAPSGKAGGAASRAAAPAATTVSTSPSGAGPVSQPRARIASQSGRMSRTVSRQSARRAPGPRPSCISTIPPGPSSGTSAASIASAGSPRQSCESAVHPVTSRPRAAATASVHAATSPHGVRQRRGRTPSSARAARARSVSRSRSARVRSPCRTWSQACRPISCPSAAIRATTSRCSSARGPRTKNVACAPSAASASSTAGVQTGSGPVVEAQLHRDARHASRSPSTMPSAASAGVSKTATAPASSQLLAAVAAGEHRDGGHAGARGRAAVPRRVADHQRRAAARPLQPRLDQVGGGLRGVHVLRRGPAVHQAARVQQVDVVLGLVRLRGAREHDGPRALGQRLQQPPRAGQRGHLVDHLAEDRRLGLPEGVAVAALHVLAGRGRDELVAAHAHQVVQHPDLAGDAVAPHRPEPRERVLVVRVDERAVDVDERRPRGSAGSGHDRPLPGGAPRQSRPASTRARLPGRVHDLQASVARLGGHAGRVQARRDGAQVVAPSARPPGSASGRARRAGAAARRGCPTC